MTTTTTTTEDMNQASIERRAVRASFSVAEQKYNCPREYLTLVWQAQEALTAWGIKYPKDAKAELLQAMELRIASFRQMAVSAALDDCNGWFDAATRQTNADKYTAKADSLTAQIEEL